MLFVLAVLQWILVSVQIFLIVPESNALTAVALTITLAMAVATTVKYFLDT